VSVSTRLSQALFIAGIALAGSVALSAGTSATSPAAPYTDPDAVGSIGLCNQSGQQITSGSVTAQPFAWRAVSTQPAPSPYNNTGRTATLVAYQPQQGLPAGDWSGTQLTSSSRYSNPANPMAAATAADQTLQNIIAEYPPKWSGFLQLRIYLGTANEQAYDQQYPSLNIQVTGDTWQAVGGSTVNCASGTAESLESALLPPTTTTAPPTTAPPSATPSISTAASAEGNGAPSGTKPDSSDRSGSESASGGSALAAGTPTEDTTESTNVPLRVGVGIAVLAVLATVTLLVVRRRRLTSHTADTVPGSATSSTKSSSTKSSSTKGDAP
jgi:hypothetical protein